MGRDPLRGFRDIRHGLSSRQMSRKGLAQGFQSLLEELVTALRSRIPFESCALYGIWKSDLRLLIHYADGNPPSYRRTIRVDTVNFLSRNQSSPEPAAEYKEFFLHSPECSVHLVPLYSGDQVRGMLLFTRAPGRPFTENEFSNAGSFYQNVAALIPLIQALSRKQESAYRLRIINRICHRIDSSMQGEDFYEKVVTLIQKAFNYDHVAIYLLDRQSNALRLQALSGKYRAIIPRDQHIPLGQGIVSWVAIHAKTHLANDVGRSSYFLNWTPDLIPTKSELCVPIVVDNQAVGVLNIESSELGFFDEDDVSAMELLTERIASSIRNTRLSLGMDANFPGLDQIMLSTRQRLMIVDREYRVRWADPILMRTLKGEDLRVGVHCDQVLGVEMSDPKLTPCGRALRTGELQQGVLRAKGGQYYFITAVPAKDSVGRVTHVLEVIEDIDKETGPRELSRSSEDAVHHEAFENIIGQNTRIRTALQLIRKFAYVDAPVLIIGESGTGKELAAKAIHQLSKRSDKPFIAINCGALPENLQESELFGHLKGSFTGAIANKKGLFEEADGGTILLDEIGEMSIATQVKLLRTIEDGEIRPVGSGQTIHVDVRILAATNRDLFSLVNGGKFRSELLYRIDVVQIGLPPLRERADDLPLLIDHFIRKYASKFGREVKGISPVAVRQLEQHDWPGNIRELENCIARAVIVCRGSSIEVDDLPPVSVASLSSARHQNLWARHEKELMLEVLQRNHWNKSRSAEELGIGATTLWRKIKKYRLKPSDAESLEA